MLKQAARDPARSKIHDAALRLFAERGGGVITISELASAAGMARGTIYNNIPNPDQLFGDVASATSHEMIARVEASMVGIEDPAARVATGIRLFVRRAHEEPHWGRFFVRFATSDDMLRAVLDEPPAHDIARAIQIGRFKLEPSMLHPLISLLSGAVLSAMHAVLSGHQTWRDAGSNAAELFLRAAGVARAEAHRTARTTLPTLVDAPAAKSKTRQGSAA